MTTMKENHLEKCPHCKRSFPTSGSQTANAPSNDQEHTAQGKQPTDETTANTVAVVEETDWERITAFVAEVWKWLRADPKRGWIAVVLIVAAVLFGWK